MIINISADTVVWFIAVMLVVLSLLLFLVLMALRIVASVIQTQIAALTKKIPNLGGAAAGGGGIGDLLGGGGIGNLLGGLMGGGK